MAHVDNWFAVVICFQFILYFSSYTTWPAAALGVTLL